MTTIDDVFYLVEANSTVCIFMETEMERAEIETLKRTSLDWNESATYSCSIVAIWPLWRLSSHETSMWSIFRTYVRFTRKTWRIPETSHANLCKDRLAHTPHFSTKG